MKKLFILLAICFYNIICVAQIQVASTGNFRCTQWRCGKNKKSIDGGWFNLTYSLIY